MGLPLQAQAFVGVSVELTTCPAVCVVKIGCRGGGTQAAQETSDHKKQGGCPQQQDAHNKPNSGGTQQAKFWRSERGRGLF